MKKLILLFFVLFLLIFASSCLSEDQSMICNNNEYYSNLITNTYSYNEFIDLKQNITYSDIYFDEFNNTYKAECIRETFQGYYVVIKLDSGNIGFAFFDKNKKLTNIHTTTSFKKSNEFDFVINNTTTKKELTAFDQNHFGIPVSSIDIITHITSDGLIVIKYNRMMNTYNNSSYNPTVQSVEFYNNYELTEKTENFFINNTPYILPIDKI